MKSVYLVHVKSGERKGSYKHEAKHVLVNERWIHVDYIEALGFRIEEALPEPKDRDAEGTPEKITVTRESVKAALDKIGYFSGDTVWRALCEEAGE